MKIKFSKIQLYTVLICIGLFITGTTLRLGLYHNIMLQRYSPLVYIGAIFIYFLKSEEKDLYRIKFSKYELLYVIIIYIVIFLQLLVYNTFISKASFVISLIFPIIILSFKFLNKNSFKQSFNLFYVFLKLSTYIIVISGLIDIFTNFSITKFIADYTNVNSYYRILKQKRIVSYMGHPLFTSEILLVFYIISHYFYIINNRIEKKSDFIFVLVGILLCQSRTAILLLLILFLIYNFNIKKLRYLLIFSLGIIIMYDLGAFDNILNRFAQFKTGDIRTISFYQLVNQNKLEFFWFKGQDVKIVSEASLYAAALEYPLYRWSYLWGIITSIILAIYIFVIPLIKVINNKQYILAVSMLSLIIDVNTYSSMGDIGMKQTFFYIIICLLINLSKYLEKEKLKK